MPTISAEFEKLVHEATLFFITARIAASTRNRISSWAWALNVRAQGVLPVAVVGTADLDVATIDGATVKLGSVSKGLFGPLPYSGSHGGSLQNGHP